MRYMIIALFAVSGCAHQSSSPDYGKPGLVRWHNLAGEAQVKCRGVPEANKMGEPARLFISFGPYFYECPRPK